VKQTKLTYDVLMAADHFIMVTTVEMPATPDKRDIEEQAWYRLTEVYGATWVLETKGFVTRVSIEVLAETPEPTVNDVVKSIEESDEQPD